MRYRPCSAPAYAVGLFLAACGSSSGAPLFGQDGPSEAGNGEPLGGASGVGSSPGAAGAGSSTFTGSGGVPATGGVSGAASGGTVAAGGSSSGSGGSSSGSGGSGPASGGVPHTDVPDAGPVEGGVEPVNCDYTGTWGTYIQVPVSWPDAPFVLIGGTGALQQWNLTEQVQQGLDVHATTVPCMIFLPDLQGSVLAGFYKYGIRFPEKLFDDGGIPSTDFVLKASVTPAGISVETDVFAILVGLSMAAPTTTAWPGAKALSLEDHDADGSPGVTVIPAIDQGYSLPPADLNGSYADRVYIAERTISQLSGTVTSCDEIDLTVQVTPVNGQSGIQSSVVGCHIENGGECTQEQADFIDGIRPQYTPTGPGTAKSVRMPPGSTCADVRAMFPKQ